jgi:hypothetical protein
MYKENMKSKHIFLSILFILFLPIFYNVRSSDESKFKRAAKIGFFLVEKGLLVQLRPEIKRKKFFMV